jgi:FkbM family methyltransferase
MSLPSTTLTLARKVAWLSKALVDPVRWHTYRFIRSGGDERWLYGDAMVTEGSTVLEVGGYLGKWVSSMRRRSRCTIHTFEPVPDFHRQLVATVAGDARTHVHGFGLGARTRRAAIGLHGDGSSLLSTSGGDVVEVDIVDVESFFADRGIGEVHLMSVNCEGGEYELLDRLIETGLVHRVACLQVQFHRVGPGYRRDAQRLRAALDSSHVRSFSFPFVWEGWRRQQGSRS